MQVIQHTQKRSSRRRRTKDQILHLLYEFENSNVKAREFCKLHNIIPANFYKWKSRYQSDDNKTSGFARVDITPSSSALHGLFAEVRGIKIYQPVSATFLKELLT